MNRDRREAFTIVLSMVAVCALGAFVLGGIYLLTSRHSEAQRRAAEAREVAALLDLQPGARVVEVVQYLTSGREVVYRISAVATHASPREVAFGLDGERIERNVAEASSAERRTPLSRWFVALREGEAVGFVVEGLASGYKNRIRFLVGVRKDFTIAGVKVIEHEEDPGLGAEIATPEFEGQFIDRPPTAAALDVTRDPMPEDWRAALAELRRSPPGAWIGRHGALRLRERGRPVYAVTGATISSRALADGVRVTLDRFRSRWERIAPHLEDERLAAAGGAR